ncbi:proteoglycan 4 [Eurosta solidaginis]|uniref:proteoglycan 4 n=1 Tax=Eurosta solidaginis TaxID=178769 RepID=UPI00353087E4
MDYRYFFILFILYVNLLSSVNGDGTFVTQTVYGFLDFTTTIGNTVMVFSPQSIPTVEKVDIPTNIIETKPFVEDPPEDDNINPTKAKDSNEPPANFSTVSTRSDESTATKPTKPTHYDKLPSEEPIRETKPDIPPTEKAVEKEEKEVKSNIVEAQTNKNSINVVTTSPLIIAAPPVLAEPAAEKKKAKTNSPEAQNKKTNNKSNKVVTNSSVVMAAPALLDQSAEPIEPIAPAEEQPTLQIENNGFEYDLLSRQPTEYAEETYRVINNKATDKPRNRHNQRRTQESAPDPTVVHETATNRLQASQAHHNKPHSPSGPKGKKPKIRNSATPSLRVLKTTSPTLPKSPAPQESKKNRPNGANRPSSSKGYRANANEQEQATITEAVTETSQNSRSHKKSSTRSKPKRKSKHNRSSSGHKNSAIVLATTAEPTRKTFRTKVKPTNVDEQQASTSVYMFKLNRTPGRWQYTTTPKPRVVIRKTAAEGNTTKVVDPFAGNPSLNVISENVDLESSGSQNGAVVNNIDQVGNYQHPVETLNVEISTPADFKDTYYELATIKTPYAFQVGGLKKTRFITVTSTIEKTLTPDPTEVSTLDGPLTENILATSTRMPSLQHDTNIATLKALHIGEHEETPSLETVVDSFTTTARKLRTQILPIVYDVHNETSYITLTQTYDITSLITVTKTMSPLETDIPLNSFADFGANLDEAGSEINLELEFGDEDNAENTKDEKPDRPKYSDIADLLGKTSGNLTAEDIQKLAMWKLQSTTQPLQQQQQTLPTLMLPSIPQFTQQQFTPDTTLPFPSIQPSINPFLLPLQQFQTITSSIVHETIATQTNSKVLKLTFGARTAYTTIFSSAVVPTRATSYITTTIPVQPNAGGAFPGYFPPPYPQYYLG